VPAADRKILEKRYEELKTNLRFETGTAIFVVKPKIEEPTPEIVESFAYYNEISIRYQIANAVGKIKKLSTEQYTIENVGKILDELVGEIPIDHPSDQREVMKFVKQITRDFATIDKDAMLKALTEFTTNREKNFIYL